MMLKVILTDRYGKKSTYNLHDTGDRSYLTEMYGHGFVAMLSQMTPGQAIGVKCCARLDDREVGF